MYQSKTYAGLSAGSHTFYVAASDALGNVGYAATTVWTIDTVLPVTTITSTAIGSTSSASASFTFSATDDSTTISSYQCKLDGAAYATCTSPQAYSGLADGSHTFYVVSLDPAGNTSVAASETWTVDNVGPASPNIYLTSGELS